ncbi:MAG: 23S rRNA (uracil(1939)-C(5))-methyltransferase RlmD [Ignavibacteriae bacterium]|nr:23S rRNA (uracil(1939)-C(5))-methyltransferase RlmD [Ignavibacteriota bacterium]
MKKIINKEIELVIDSIGFEGVSIARKEGLVYLVKGGIPGEKILAIEKRKKRRYTEAVTREIIEPSKYRTEAKCRHFGVCGGCSWQNLKYEQQLFWKRQHIIDSFKHIAKIDNIEVADTLPSPKEYRYRNKMEFSFGSSRWLTDNEIEDEKDIENKSFALGLHVPGRYDKVLDIDECYLIDNLALSVLIDIKNKALDSDIKPFSEKTHHGFLKNLVFRIVSSGKTMVILITTDYSNEEEKKFVDWVFNHLKNNLKIDSIIHAVNNSVNTVAVGDIKRTEGEDSLIEEIEGVKFKISPFSFFQTNTGQLPSFMNSIIELSQFNNSDIVWDLFCGTGAISLALSGIVQSVYGIELNENSISDAKENARLNNIKNTEFMAYDLNSKTPGEIFKYLPECDVLVLDPPRAGLHKNLIDFILKISPLKIIYVSCNPASQARDYSLLEEFYKIFKIQPVDMFPHTYHIESIAGLIKR